MLKNIFCALACFFIFQISVSAQDEALQSLLQNDRASALEKINQSNPENIEEFIFREIVKTENGKFMQSDKFIEQLLNYDEFEPYLFAYWKDGFVFDDYLSDGLSPAAQKNIDQLSDHDFDSALLDNALQYLKAVASRQNGDFEGYYSDMQGLAGIREWQYCGVFENLNGSGIYTEYDPETIAVSKTGFDTQGRGIVNWYTPQGYEKEAYKFFTNHDEFGYGVNYAQTFVYSPKDQRVVLHTGRGGALKVFVNDVPVITETKDVFTEMWSNSVEVNLKKGYNRIVVKVATSKMTPYFIAAITDEKGVEIDGLTYSASPQSYDKSNIEEVNPQALDHKLISYFIQKRDPEDKTSVESFVNDLALISAYMRNSQHQEALEVMDEWVKIYPQSSILRANLMTIYNLSERSEQAVEVQKNMRRDDSEYVMSLMAEFQETDKLFKRDLADFNGFIDKLKNATDFSFIAYMADIMSALRSGNQVALREHLDALVIDETAPSKLMVTLIPIYDQVLQDKSRMQELLEKFNREHFNYESLSTLANYYINTNNADKAKTLFEVYMPYLKNENWFMLDYVKILLTQEKYSEAIKILEDIEANFPYSYRVAKEKGETFLKLNKKDDALVAFEEALSRAPSDNSLRMRIYDLKGVADPLERLRTQDIYAYIKTNRNTIESNNYGLNQLLQEINLQIYEQGGGRYRKTLAMEVTSKDGVEDMKEYNLGINGFTLYKAEVIKPDGSLVPAERSGSNFVFNNLIPGDVVLIDFEASFGNSGRFYKDFIDDHSFEGYHPKLKDTYTIIAPKDFKFDYTVSNGDLIFTENKQGDFIEYRWETDGVTELNAYEDFAPVLEDIATKLHISSIKDWDEIADWYSDLVNNQLEYDGEVQKAFDAIFPEGYRNLSETERAKRIYSYMTDELSYSYVSFKQSGFVPQKPSKTLTSKLGDCKDFSTLFVCLAAKADLKAQLVLVLTSDNGEQALVMPSTSFNHCIAKVELEGENQYLELTSKFLPFRSIPTSLQDAIMLDIPSNKNKNSSTSELYHLRDALRKKAVKKYNAIVNLNEQQSAIHLNASFTAQAASYYRDLLIDSNIDVVKKDVLENFRSNSGLDLDIVDLKDIEKDNSEGDISFNVDFKWNNKPQKIGSLKTISIPFLSLPYTSSLVQEEARNFPIDYKGYEDIDGYEENITLELDKGLKFSEVPENVSLSFKDHSFSLEYNLEKDNLLVVKMQAAISNENIAPDDYLEFKKYVDKVLEAKESLIGFK